jgi:D-amino-acid dehydrogenase
VRGRHPSPSRQLPAPRPTGRECGPGRTSGRPPLGPVVRWASIRGGDGGTTPFESVGVAFEDAAAAAPPGSVSAVERRFSGRADVAVIGAGAIGACVSLELASSGADVAVIERGSGWAEACSRGNAGLICPSHAGPFATRADLVESARWLLRRDSPLRISPRPALLPWLARLGGAARSSREAHTRAVLGELARRSLDLHRDLAARGLRTGFDQQGLLDVYESERGFDRARRRAAKLGAEGGRELGPAEIHRAEPALIGKVAGGFFHSGEAHCDPLAFVEAVGGAAEQAGARLVSRGEVLDLDAERRGVDLLTTRGAVRAERVVVAAGSWSRGLAARIGRRLPLEPGKGYAVDIVASELPRVRRPMILEEARIAVTPFPGALRLAGMIEFAGLDPVIDLRRVRALQAAACRAFPPFLGARRANVWTGLRPCTPDGIPVIGWLDPSARVAVASGHAMLGLTLAPVTGQLVSGLLAGRPSEELGALSPERFTPGLRRYGRSLRRA